MESEYFRVIENDDATMLDLYTDALMMNTMIYESDQSNFVNAVAAHHYFNEGQTMQQSFLDLVEEKDRRERGLCLCTILAWIPAAAKVGIVFNDLSRLSHLKPVFTNPFVRPGRKTMAEQGGRKLVVPFISCFCLSNACRYGLLLTVFVYCVYHIDCDDSIISFPRETGSKKNAIYFFFIIGVVTNYFDLLTYPLITFGIPAVLLLFSGKRK